jgi:DNA-binding transcriptional MerR regulator
VRFKAFDDKDAEIGRLKAQHEDMLLKHAKEQGVALSSLETALEQIQAQKEVIESLSDHSAAAERMALLKAQAAQIDALKNEILELGHRVKLSDYQKLQSLCASALYALEGKLAVVPTSLLNQLRDATK